MKNTEAGLEFLEHVTDVRHPLRMTEADLMRMSLWTQSRVNVAMQSSKACFTDLRGQKSTNNVVVP